MVGSYLGVFLALFATCHISRWADGAGAGRAFPMDSENYAIKTFKNINPSIEWDPTNFLIDLSGHYANCNYMNQKGELKADRKTPEGEEVTVAIDTTPGEASDVNNVNRYVQDVLNRWQQNSMYHNQIRNNKRVGCSVRPACSGITVVACVFSSGDGKGGRGPWFDTGKGEGGRWEDRGDNSQYVKGRETEHIKWNGEEIKGEELKESELGFIVDEDPKALAFTPEQYKIAEGIMGKKWEPTHFLENLSGFETDCSMIGKRDWPWDYKSKIEREVKLHITGQYGYSLNKGSTTDAMKEVLNTFKPVANTHSIGCSVIPHCRSEASMYVVVGCLYEWD
uniref:Regeneration-upregulated protein 5 n=1 Tax=Enchytraeus japonensis TaxID=228735 RepID=Q1MX37_9ANNE|nr:regeneration-upregulated protein 5 [Enchytraeus japonensis]